MLKSINQMESTPDFNEHFDWQDCLPLVLSQNHPGEERNVLDGNLDEDALDRLSLCYYMCRFVEQEFASSVVQLMRHRLGIPMPKGFCRWVKGHEAVVDVGDRMVNLNRCANLDHQTLVRLSLTDAYEAFESLLLDHPALFSSYPWLGEENFLSSWRRLGAFAQIVSTVDACVSCERLTEAMQDFSCLMSYQSHLMMLRNELNAELTKELTSQTMHGCKNAQNGDGLWGVVNANNEWVVPPLYSESNYPIDKVDELPQLVPMRSGQYQGLVATDGSGAEATPFIYDELQPIMDYRSHWMGRYLFRRGGCRTWGIMERDGTEVAGAVVDEVEWCSRHMYFSRGERHGAWLENGLLIPAVYTEISPVDVVKSLPQAMGFFRGDNLRLVTTNGTELSPDELPENLIREVVCDQ